MTELVDRLFNQEQPDLGDLIVSRARNSDRLTQVERFNVTTEGPPQESLVFDNRNGFATIPQVQKKWYNIIYFHR